MKNHFSSVKLLRTKAGNALPVVLFLIIILTAVGGLVFSKNRLNSTKTDKERDLIQASSESPYNLLEQLGKMAQLNVSSPTPASNKNTAGTCALGNALDGICTPIRDHLLHPGYTGHKGTDYYNPAHLQDEFATVYAAEAGEVLSVRNLQIRDSACYNAATKYQAPGYCGDGTCWDKPNNLKPGATGDCVWQQHSSLPFGLFYGYGNGIVIKHADSTTLYGHLDNGSLLVQPGDCVYKGKPIAKKGNTGSSTGFHLHFEIREKSNGNYCYDDDCAININKDYKTDADCTYGSGGTTITPPPGATDYPVPTLPPGVTITPPPWDDGTEPQSSFSKFSEKQLDSDGMISMLSLPQRNADSCESKILKIDDVNYPNQSTIKEIFGKNADGNQVNGLWEPGDPTTFKTKLKLVPCSSDANPEFTCTSADNYTSGYSWTGCVKDFPLLNYLAASQSTDDNNHKTTKEKLAFKNIVADGNMDDNNGNLTLNFTNITPGTVWQVDNKGHIFQAKVPLLGGAISSGTIYWKDFNHLTHISTDLVDIKNDTNGYIVEQREDNVIGKLSNWFKELFVNSTISFDTNCVTSSSNTEECNELVTVDTMCKNLEYGAITKINESDKALFAFADEDGVCEQIVDAGNFELSKSNICDKQFLNTGNSTGKIAGADCRLDVTGYGSFNFTDRNLRLPIKNTAIRNAFTDYECANNISKSLCQKDFTCEDSVLEVYKQCRSINQEVQSISGTPEIELTRDSTWDNLSVEGLNKYLVNVVQEEKDFMYPQGVYIVAENVGIRVHTCFSLYDLQTVNGRINNVQRDEFEKKYLGRIADESKDEVFDPKKVDGYVSKELDRIKNLNTNNPLNNLAKYINIDPSAYNPQFSGGFQLAKDTQTGKDERICYTYFFPFTGEIPRANERTAFFSNEMFAKDSGKSYTSFGISTTGTPAVQPNSDYNWRENLDEEKLKYLLIPLDPQVIDPNDPNQDYIATTSDRVSQLEEYLKDSGLGTKECIPYESIIAKDKNKYGDVKNIFKLPVCSPKTSNITGTPQPTATPVIPGTTGPTTPVPTVTVPAGGEQNLQCLMVKVADIINNSDANGARIPWEALYAITKKETALKCNIGHFDFDLNKNGKIDSDPNGDGNKIDTEEGWYDYLSYPLCDGNPNRIGMGIDSNYLDNIDIRGITQFSRNTFKAIATNNYWEGDLESAGYVLEHNGKKYHYKYDMPSNTQNLLDQCVTQLGITSQYRKDTNEININIEDAAKKDPTNRLYDSDLFSRARIGDALCATALMISDLAGSAAGGQYVKPENWTDETIVTGAGPYHGNCSLNYCDITIQYFHEAQNLTPNLQCN